MKKINPIDILSGNVLYPNLIEELLDYGNKMNDNLFERKVLRVWTRCKRANKNSIADKIRNKYSKYFQIKSDSVRALALSIAINQTEK